MLDISWTKPKYSEGAKYSNKEKRLHYPAEAIQMFENKSPQLYTLYRKAIANLNASHAQATLIAIQSIMKFNLEISSRYYS